MGFQGLFKYILFIAISTGAISSAALAKSITTEGLLTLARGSQDVDSLLRKLPTDLRRSFLLAYKSESLQQYDVDAKHPRIVMFGKDAKMIIGLTGKKNGSLYNTMEVMEFDDRTDRFNLHEITLKPTTPGRAAQVSITSNPSHCKGCHMSDSRPIWDEYETWPGFYGSRNDFLDDPKATQERKDYVAFLANRPPRYKSLLYGNFSPLPPFNALPHHPDLNRRDTAWLEIRPGLRFTKLVARLGAKRIARKILSSPGFQRKKLDVLEQLAFPLRPYRYDVLATLGLNSDDMRFSREGLKQTSRMGGGNMDYWDGAARLRDLVAYEVFERVAKRDPELRSYFYGKPFGEGDKVSDIDRYFPAINFLGKVLNTRDLDVYLDRKRRLER